MSALSALADDKPRVSLSVSKRTVAQPTEKTVAGDERGRVQTLIVVAENLSSHALLEGSLQWTAVVRKVTGGSLKYTGTEVMKPMRSFQSVEMQCGAFEIESRPGVASIERDRIDFEVILLHSGKESARAVSTASFAALLEKAQPAVIDPNAAVKIAKAGDTPAVKPAEPMTLGADKITPPRVPAAAAESARPVIEAPPVPQQKFDFFNLAGKSPLPK